MLRRISSGLLIRLHVKPNSAKERIVDIHDGCVHVAVTGPPRDGQANREVIRLLTKILGMRNSQASVVSGQKSREKVVLIHSDVPEEFHPREQAHISQRLTEAVGRQNTSKASPKHH